MDATFIWKLSKLGRIGSSRLRYDDDFADRLNYQYSGVLMFLFIGIVGIRQYVGKPIQCWIPQEFTRGWEEYAENYCWVSNTYFSPLAKTLPPNNEREANLIVYYQWAPILMAIQALLFYLPCLVWRLFNSNSGFNVRRIMQMANDSNVLLPEHGIKNVRYIARYIEGCIFRQRDYRHNNRRGESNIGSYTMHPLLPYPNHFHAGLQHFSAAQQSSPSMSSTERPDYKTHTKLLSKTTSCNPLEQMHSVQLSTKCEQTKAGSGDRINPVGQERIKCGQSTLCERLKYFFLCRSRSNLKSYRSRNRLHSKHNFDNLTHTGATLLPHDKRGKDKGLCCFCYKHSCWRSRCCGKCNGNFLVVLYFLMKVLYLINIIGQIMIMERFVGTNHAFYGIRILLDLIYGTEWYSSGNFPRVTFCDFEAKKLGKNQRYTIQCVLPLNMFLEKIFIFLWFWHCILGLITIVSLFDWFTRMGFAKHRLKFIRNYLKIMAVINEADKAATKKFVEHFLRPDGVFLIRLISVNIGDLMAGDLACELWHNYRHRRLLDAEEMKYIEPMSKLPSYFGSNHQQHPRVVGLGHDEFGAISAPERDKLLLAMHNGADDSIV